MRLLAVFLLVLAAWPAAAQPRNPLLEMAASPGLSQADRASVERFLRYPVPRVLALGPNGAIGWQSRGSTPDEIERGALEICQRRSGGAPCQVAVRDLAVVLPGRAWTPPEPPAGMRLSSWNHETVPDPRFIWWGPEQARGVLVFAHGRGAGDSRGGQPQAWTRRFNNAGYDVWPMSGASTAIPIRTTPYPQPGGCAGTSRSCGGAATATSSWPASRAGAGTR